MFTGVVDVKCNVADYNDFISEARVKSEFREAFVEFYNKTFK